MILIVTVLLLGVEKEIAGIGRAKTKSRARRKV